VKVNKAGGAHSRQQRSTKYLYNFSRESWS